MFIIFYTFYLKPEPIIFFPRSDENPTGSTTLGTGDTSMCAKNLAYIYFFNFLFTVLYCTGTYCRHIRRE